MRTAIKLLFLFAGYAIALSVVMARRGVWPQRTASALKATSAPIRRVLVIGATGGTGRELVRQALERGYDVTAFVRDPAKLDVRHPQLTVMRGNVLDYAAVEEAVRDQDAVVSALGHRRLFVPSRVQSDGTRNVLRAMETHGVRRFVCETALGLGSSAGMLGLLPTFSFLPLCLPIYFWDKSRQEQAIAASSVDWVIVRPGVLTDAAKSDTYRHGNEVGSYVGITRSSRADVADFMLNQLTADTYLRAAPGIAS